MSKIEKPKKTIEQSLLDRILYIGDKIPESLLGDTRPKFILLGCPEDVIDETNITTLPKSKFEIGCWIAEYAYKKANPNGKFSEPPSMVYEQVAKDFSDFLSN
jgi:hypothetical protein